jgi:hypothetical protein
MIDIRSTPLEKTASTVDSTRGIDAARLKLNENVAGVKQALAAAGREVQEFCCEHVDQTPLAEPHIPNEQSEGACREQREQRGEKNVVRGQNPVLSLNLNSPRVSQGACLAFHDSLLTGFPALRRRSEPVQTPKDIVGLCVHEAELSESPMDY